MLMIYIYLYMYRASSSLWLRRFILVSSTRLYTNLFYFPSSILSTPFLVPVHRVFRKQIFRMR